MCVRVSPGSVPYSTDTPSVQIAVGRTLSDLNECVVSSVVRQPNGDLDCELESATEGCLVALSLSLDPSAAATAVETNMQPMEQPVQPAVPSNASAALASSAVPSTASTPHFYEQSCNAGFGRVDVSSSARASEVDGVPPAQEQPSLEVPQQGEPAVGVASPGQHGGEETVQEGQSRGAGQGRVLRAERIKVLGKVRMGYR